MTDIMGNLLAVIVHAANIHDTKGGVQVFDETIARYPSIKAVSGDMGYRGTFHDYVVNAGYKCDITERIKPKVWAVTPKRWVVERSFGWASHSRRLSKDYEITTSSEIAWFTISHCHTILRRY
jgi:putative transposase